MRRSLVILSVTLAIVTATRAETRYSAEIGHWTVTAEKAGCQAVNRPMSELGFMAINTVFMVMTAAGEVRMAVALWPSALTGKEDSMLVKIDGAGDYMVPVHTSLEPWTAAMAKLPISEEMRTVLSGKGGQPLYRMHVSVPGGNWTTHFDIEDMPGVMTELGKCAELAKADSQ